MKLLIAIPLLLSLSMCKAYAETPCERARQHASSIEQLATLAASVGIIMSEKDKAEYAKCFKKRKHR